MKANRDKHLTMVRLPNQLPEWLPAKEKGVIRYTMFNTSKTYKPNGKRECARRVRQMLKQGRLDYIPVRPEIMEELRAA